MLLVAVLAFASPDVMSHGTAPAPAAQERSGQGALRIAHGSRAGGAPLRAIDENASALPRHFTPPPPHPAAMAKSDFAGIVEQLIEKSSEVRRLQEREKTAPYSSWFGDTKSSIREKLSATFVSVQEILFAGTLYDYVGQFEKQRENLHQSKAEIDAYEQNISAITRSIQSRFDSIGIGLSDSQILIFLNRIDSRDILTFVELLNINKNTINLLNENMKNDINNSDVIRNNYDIYLLMLETIIYNQQIAISRIREAYMPRVQKVIAQAVEEIGITNRLLDKNPVEPQKSELEDALRASLLTRTMAISYANLLKDQAARIASAKMRAEENFRVAYAVLTNAGTSADLIFDVDQSRQDLDLLAGLQSPVIEPFGSDQEAQAFADLTVRLRGMN